MPIAAPGGPKRVYPRAADRLRGRARLGLAPQDCAGAISSRPEAIPYATPLGLVYDSGEFPATWTMLSPPPMLRLFGAPYGGAIAGLHRGLGYAVYIEQSGMPPDEFAEMRFDPSGTLTMLLGTQSAGQGHQTATPRFPPNGLVCRSAGSAFVQGDTAAIAFGRGTGGARSLPVGGASSSCRAENDRKGPPYRRAFLEAAEADIDFSDGVIRISGTDREVGIEAVSASRSNPAQLPDDVDQALPKAAFHPALADLPQMAAMSARSRSSPRPAISTSCAISSSMISARSSTRCSCKVSTGRRRSGSRSGDAREASSTPRPASS